MVEILVITPISHLPGVEETLSSVGIVTVQDSQRVSELSEHLSTTEAIFTNPNKASFFLGAEVFDQAPNLRVICSASTGTNHIDLEAAASRKIEVLSLADDREFIRSISSTAEHAMALTLGALRNVVPASESVRRGEWDYVPYIGRQFRNLTVGVVGCGRLGHMYAQFALSLAREVLYYDPFVSRSDCGQKVVSLEEIVRRSDVISLHVHPTPDTIGMVGQGLLQQAKPDLLIVNTSRGEIVNENAVVDFLLENPNAKYATDVIAGETHSRDASPVLRMAHRSNQVLVTPHIGGMTWQGQKAAFSFAAEKLAQYLKQTSGHSV